MLLGDTKYILGPIITVLLSQIIKFIVESLQHKKLRWGRLFNGTGGIPSSHNAFVFSLTTMIGINEGIYSPYFAIALIFSLVIMYDSFSLRMATENQAKTINQLVDAVISGKGKRSFKILKEEIGHEPIEVLLGIAFGVIMGFILGI